MGGIDAACASVARSVCTPAPALSTTWSLAPSANRTLFVARLTGASATRTAAAVRRALLPSVFFNSTRHEFGTLCRATTDERPATRASLHSVFGSTFVNRTKISMNAIYSLTRLAWSSSAHLHPANLLVCCFSGQGGFDLVIYIFATEAMTTSSGPPPYRDGWSLAGETTLFHVHRGHKHRSRDVLPASKRARWVAQEFLSRGGDRHERLSETLDLALAKAAICWSTKVTQSRRCLMFVERTSTLRKRGTRSPKRPTACPQTCVPRARGSCAKHCSIVLER